MVDDGQWTLNGEKHRRVSPSSRGYDRTNTWIYRDSIAPELKKVREETPRKKPSRKSKKEPSLPQSLSQDDINKIREARIVECLYMVMSMAQRYTGRGVDLDDLIQAGNEGLMKAGQKYDEVKYPNVKFSSYATWWILQKILREIYDHSRTIKIHPRVHQNIVKIKMEEAKTEEGAEIDPNTLERLGITPKQYEIAMKCRELECMSLDYQIDEGSSPVVEMTPGTFSDPEELVSRQEQREVLVSLLDKLPERSRKIIEMRWECNGYNHIHSLQECGAVYQLTRERARQLENEAMAELRKHAGVRLNGTDKGTRLGDLKGKGEKRRKE